LAPAAPLCCASAEKTLAATWPSACGSAASAPPAVEAPAPAPSTAAISMAVCGALLELELTESLLLADVDDTAAKMATLKAHGVGFSLDDFGTGYSSLAYLKKFPLDGLKIDRSFINDLPGDTDDEAITSAILALSKALRLGVVAEGVETREQFNFLRDAGCQVAQGYLFSRPLVFTDFLSWLQRTRPG
jgi:EAL domain-containing protein (putative c-di-GMP-specific phosphodiesterase class I)